MAAFHGENEKSNPRIKTFLFKKDRQREPLHYKTTSFFIGQPFQKTVRSPIENVSHYWIDVFSGFWPSEPYEFLTFPQTPGLAFWQKFAIFLTELRIFPIRSAEEQYCPLYPKTIGVWKMEVITFAINNTDNKLEVSILKDQSSMTTE